MLEVRGLDVNIGPVPILRGVGLEVPPGSMRGTAHPVQYQDRISTVAIQGAIGLINHA